MFIVGWRYIDSQSLMFSAHISAQHMGGSSIWSNGTLTFQLELMSPHVSTVTQDGMIHNMYSTLILA